MPRPPRAAPPGVVVHAVTRGNARATVFHSQQDFDGFLELMRRGTERAAVDLLGWCLMPNHVHLVARPRTAGALSGFMHWLLTTYALRYRSNHGASGHVWQGRYKSFAVQTDRHFVTLLRYVERNPVRAGLVERAEHWTWSSLRERARASAANGLLTPSPVSLPEPWSPLVDEALTSAELSRLRESVRRGRPFGDLAWERGMVERLGLTSTVNPRGRPAGVWKKKGPDPFRMPG